MSVPQALRFKLIGSKGSNLLPERHGLYMSTARGKETQSTGGFTSRLAAKWRAFWHLVDSKGFKVAIKRIPKALAGGKLPEPLELFVSLDDAAQVDWTVRSEQLLNPVKVKSGPISIAWIMSPPGAESGGHQNIFRFINFAEQAGHKCSVYLYQAESEEIDINRAANIISHSDAYPKIKAKIHKYDPLNGVEADTQAIFATGWETAYPSYLDKSNAKRFYFIQDFEPSFFPMGSDALLAENTYRFGFHGITAGPWLAHMVSEKYGMKADFFDFAVDKSIYNLINTSARNEIFFYARPVTPRRAFEFGLVTLTDFAQLRPDITINLAGWDVSNWEIPFPHVNLSSMPLSELNEVYNRCAAGLVLSLTNMSLLPLELISSGVTPVVNEGPNNRMVSDNPFIEYVPASPAAIARKLVEVVEREDAIQRSIEMSRSVKNVDWSESAKQFLSALEGAMHG